MKKYCGWKKTAAFLMSMALVAGAAPVNAGGILKVNSIVASAAEEEESEVKTPAVGAFFKKGDTIGVTGETWFVVDDDPHAGDARGMIKENVKITDYVNSNSDNQYIWQTGDVELYLLHKGFYITRQDPAVDPEGFYITGGKGTYEEPFVIGLSVPKFSSKNITLNDSFGMNFIVGEANANNCNDLKVKFSGDCEEAGEEFQSLELKTINGQEVYCVTANVTANKMDSIITADLYFSDGETPVDTLAFSVNEYLDEIDTTDNTKLEALVNATKQYGNVSAAYFGNGELPDVKDHSDEILNTAYSFGDFSYNVYAPRFDSSTASMSLVLNSKLAVRLYTAKYEDTHHDTAAYDMWIFDEKEGLVITSPTTIYAIEGANGKVCFEVPGITPTQLGTTFNVNYQGTDYLFTPMSWAYRVLSHDGAPKKDVAIANALYEYYIAATNYTA